jgi:hypothetical protein
LAPGDPSDRRSHFDESIEGEAVMISTRQMPGRWPTASFLRNYRAAQPGDGACQLTTTVNGAIVWGPAGMANRRRWPSGAAGGHRHPKPRHLPPG